jgi:hypothetical protein
MSVKWSARRQNLEVCELYLKNRPVYLVAAASLEFGLEAVRL